jgi:hypothetical protein
MKFVGDLKLKIVENSKPMMLIKYVYKGKNVKVAELHGLKTNRAYADEA